MSRFHNRRDAGRQLAAQILNGGVLDAHKGGGKTQVIVLGIPRGGVPVADEIARSLGAPLDVFITRKIGAPFNPELAIGAIASDGTVFLDSALIRELGISPELIEMERKEQEGEIQRRMEMYRRGKPPLSLENRIVILADDGIATGATTIAALRAVRHNHPAQTILAVPVAPPPVIPILRDECDQVVVLDTPEPFVAVGYFFKDFEQVTDQEVIEILSRSG